MKFALLSLLLAALAAHDARAQLWSPTNEFSPCDGLASSECWAKSFNGDSLTDDIMIITEVESTENGPAAFSMGGGHLMETSGISSDEAVVPATIDGGACARLTGAAAIFSGSEAVSTSAELNPDEFWTYRVLLASSDDNNGSIGIVWNYIDANNYNRISFDKEASCLLVIRTKEGARTVLNTVTIEDSGWETGVYYEIRLNQETDIRYRVTIVGWADGSRQSFLFDDRDAVNGGLNGKFGVFCAGTQDCLFDRAYAYRLRAATQLSGANQCEQCETESIAIAWGTSGWCRCCGEGGTGCAPFTKQACIDESGMCSSYCTSTSYCEGIVTEPTTTSTTTTTTTTDPTASSTSSTTSTTSPYSGEYGENVPMGNGIYPMLNARITQGQVLTSADGSSPALLHVKLPGLQHLLDCNCVVTLNQDLRVNIDYLYVEAWLKESTAGGAAAIAEGETVERSVLRLVMAPGSAVQGGYRNVYFDWVADTRLDNEECFQLEPIQTIDTTGEYELRVRATKDCVTGGGGPTPPSPPSSPGNGGQATQVQRTTSAAGSTTKSDGSSGLSGDDDDDSSDDDNTLLIVLLVLLVLFCLAIAAALIFFFVFSNSRDEPPPAQRRASFASSGRVRSSRRMNASGRNLRTSGSGRRGSRRY